MANFPCNPMLYVPMGQHIEDGWLRPARSRVALGGEPPRRHEQYAIIRLQPEPVQAQVIDLIQDVSEFLEDEFPVRVVSGYPSPLGLGLFQFDNPVQRQVLLDASPIPFGHGSLVVQRHDESINLRACAYVRQCWVMFLAFPLDYQTLDFIKASIAPFGRLLHWFEGPNKSRILTQCLVISPERVPRSVVISQGSVNGGNGRSWSVPVFILGGHFPDAFPGDEDPVPENGNPHPVHAHAINVNVNAAQHWHHEQMGGQQGNQMDHGINEQHWQAAQDDLVVPEENDAVGNGWEAWPDNVADNMDLDDAQLEQVPQHPGQPQDTISFDQSGSTAEYLRENGPDITLTVEDVQRISGSLVPNLEESAYSPAPMFRLSAAFQKYEVLAFGKLGMGSVHQPILPQPILHRFIIQLPQQTAGGNRTWGKAFEKGSSSAVQPEDLTKAIVPCQPVLHVILLHLWVHIVNAAPRAAVSVQEGSPLNISGNGNDANLMGDVEIGDIQAEQGIEQAEQGIEQAEQQTSSAKKCLLTAFEATTRTGRTGLPPRPPRKVVSLPTLVAGDNDAVPLVTSTVRRSPRLNKNADGYKHCQLGDATRKRKKGQGNVLSKKGKQTVVDNTIGSTDDLARPQALKDIPVTQAELEGPIPMEMLRGWGIDCGVSPSEITDDLLLQGSPARVSNEDTPSNNNA
ncbi:unnamed protein product [Urochloa humidicola]